MRKEKREALMEIVNERVKEKREKALQEKKRKERIEYWKKESERKREILCSFCGENSDDVSFMITGPNNVNICNNCVQLCNEVIEERLKKD